MSLVNERREIVSLVNEAVWDRIARVALGLVFLYLGWSSAVDGGWGLFFKVFGFAPLATGLSGWCPTYTLFGFRTNAKTVGQARVG